MRKPDVLITPAMKRASKQNLWFGIFPTFWGAILSGYILVEWVRGHTFSLLSFSFVAAQAIGLLLMGVSSLMASRYILQNRIRPYGWVQHSIGILLVCYGLLGKGVKDGTVPSGFLIGLAALLIVFTGLLFVAISKQAKQKAAVKLDK